MRAFTDKEKAATTISGVVALAMLLFPPWQAQANGITFNLGYHFIASGPVFGFIDVTRLILQFLFLAGLVYGATKFSR